MKNKDVREVVSSRDGPEGENINKYLFKDAKNIQIIEKNLYLANHSNFVRT